MSHDTAIRIYHPKNFVACVQTESKAALAQIALETVGLLGVELRNIPGWDITQKDRLLRPVGGERLFDSPSPFCFEGKAFNIRVDGPIPC